MPILFQDILRYFSNELAGKEGSQAGRPKNGPPPRRVGNGPHKHPRQKGARTRYLVADNPVGDAGGDVAVTTRQLAIALIKNSLSPLEKPLTRSQGPG